MTILMKKTISFFLIIILSVPIFITCKKAKGDPPVVPPVESMLIDFSNFTSLKKSVEVQSGTKGTANSNFEFASTAAGMWNLINETTLVVPIACYNATYVKTPVWISENTWEFGSSVIVGNITYKARLVGQISGKKVIWKLYVAREGSGSFPEFIWVDGESASDGSSGQWIFNQSYSTQESLLQVDWTKSGSDIESVKYTYLKNDALKTSYIEYTHISGNLDSKYTIYYFNGVKFSNVLTEWNATTKNGRVQSLEYLGDSNWYCWDSNKINITCP
jgi:hypothetical protein